jgi:hypothetical protein
MVDGGDAVHVCLLLDPPSSSRFIFIVIAISIIISRIAVVDIWLVVNILQGRSVIGRACR